MRVYTFIEGGEMTVQFDNDGTCVDCGTTISSGSLCSACAAKQAKTIRESPPSPE